MVQRIFYAIGLLVSATVGSACISTPESEDEFGSHVIGGSTPVLIGSDPVQAAPGDSVAIVGSGFSIVAAENIVSIGGAAAVASEYSIDGGGNQILTVDIPSEAPEGDQSLLVIVNGTPSNALDFTVTP